MSDKKEVKIINFMLNGLLFGVVAYLGYFIVESKMIKVKHIETLYQSPLCVFVIAAPMLFTIAFSILRKRHILAGGILLCLIFCGVTFSATPKHSESIIILYVAYYALSFLFCNLAVLMDSGHSVFNNVSFGSGSGKRRSFSLSFHDDSSITDPQYNPGCPGGGCF